MKRSPPEIIDRFAYRSATVVTPAAVPAVFYILKTRGRFFRLDTTAVPAYTWVIMKTESQHYVKTCKKEIN